MTCCVPYILPFNNVSITTIGYTETMQNLYGRVPDVQIYYRESNGEYGKAINPSGIRLSGNPVDTVTVDHGGPGAVGFIKII